MSTPRPLFGHSAGAPTGWVEPCWQGATTPFDAIIETSEQMSQSDTTSESIAQSASRGQSTNVFANRVIRDVVVQGSLAFGLLFLIWFFTYNFSQQEGGTDWAFLTNNSKVDQPDPRPLPVNNQSSVLSVFASGLLNTLIVAVIGIVLATVLGFLVGVMRLSKNILLSRIAQVYIEVLRNIPLAVQLLFLNAILLAMPGIGNGSPINFLGALFHNESFNFPGLQFGDGVGGGTWMGVVPFDYSWVPTLRSWNGSEFGTDWLIVIPAALAFVVLVGLTFFRFFPALEAWSEAEKVNGRVKNRTRMSIAGFVSAAALSVLILLFFSIQTVFPPLLGWSLLAVFAIAVLIGNAIRQAIINWADDRLDETGKRPNVDFLAWLIMGLFVLGIMLWLGGPVSIENYVFNDKGRPEFGFSVPVGLIALTGALAIYTSAFIAEIVRAGIQSVNKGQGEAAASLGLREGRILSLITIPQALKVIVPPLNSQFMNLAKNSSLAFILKYPDLVQVLDTTRNNTGRELEVAIMILLSYLSISLTISIAMNYVNDRVQLVER